MSKILCVDQEKAMEIIYREVILPQHFKRQAYDLGELVEGFDFVTSHEEAFDLYQDGDYCLVISNLGRNKEGLEFIRNIHSFDNEIEQRKVPVILVSGHFSGKKEAEKVRAAYFKKPLEIEPFREEAIEMIIQYLLNSELGSSGEWGSKEYSLA